MHRLALLVSIGALLTADLAAQVNTFGIYPGATTYSSRSGIPGNHRGDVCLELSSASFRGLGQFNDFDGGGRIDGFRVIIQDQDASTTERFGFALFAGSSANGPGRELVSTARFPTPDGDPGPRSWTVSITVASPFRALPREATAFLAVRLPANNRWPQDGLSVHHADYERGLKGDSPKASAPNLTWVVDRDAGDAVSQPGPRVPAVFFTTEGPVLRAGAHLAPDNQRSSNPQFGAAGLFPDRTQATGIAFRIAAQGHEGETYAVVGAPLGFAKFTLPFVTNPVWVQAPFAPDLLLTGTLDGNGQAEGVVPFAPYPLLVSFGQMAFQGVLIAPGFRAITMTNAALANDQ